MGMMKELWLDQREDDMSEYLFAMEEQAFFNAVEDLADFIRSGEVTYEQACRAIREALRGNKD